MRELGSTPVAEPTAHPTRTTRRAPRPRHVADDDPRLAPYLRGVRLAITFTGESVVERRVDERAIARIASLMRDDHGQRAEVIVSASTEPLSTQRAHSEKRHIAIRGPSRSRFTLRARASPEPSVLVRLVR
jgi:hypothetical protein